MSDLAPDYRHFRIHRREDGSLWDLGEGAMGVTYKAFDVRTDPRIRRDVALKVIKKELLDSDTARKRFLREALATNKLRHPNVATIFDLGEDARACFYAMEYIEGETGEALVKRVGPLDAVNALRIILPVAKVLQQAHSLRPCLLHRDLKPANLMVTLEGGEIQSKVIDFGIAKFLHDSKYPASSPGLTIPGDFVGTPAFASPEQWLQEDLDGRSDLYSLGAMLWYLLTGKHVFLGANAISQKVGKPPPLERLAGQPAEVVELLGNLLARERDDRPADGSVVRGRIERIVRALDPDWQVPPPPPPPAAPRTSADDAVPSSVEKPQAAAIAPGPAADPVPAARGAKDNPPVLAAVPGPGGIHGVAEAPPQPRVPSGPGSNLAD